MAAETKDAASDEAKEELENLEMGSTETVGEYCARVNVYFQNYINIALLSRGGKFADTFFLVYLSDFVTRCVHLQGGEF